MRVSTHPQSYGQINQPEAKKDYNEKFIEKYNYRERDKALSYLDRDDIDLDINYEEGSFLIQAIREDDAELVKSCLRKGLMLGY
jgi:hypothetical protein